MVDISGGAEAQRGELGSMGSSLDELRTATVQMAELAERAAQLGEEIRTVADRQRGDVAAAGTALIAVREVVASTSKMIKVGADESDGIDCFDDLHQGPLH